MSSSPPATIRWGIIGCGDVTEVKSGPALQKARGSQLVAVMRRDGARAADYAQRHGVPRWYDDARALVNDPDVDAVYVATPPNAHLDSALLAAAAGKPAYVEKPMARHTPECDAMSAAFARANRKLFVAYYRRALPRFVKAKELLEGGALGTLTGISFRFASPGHGGTGVAPGAPPPPMGWRIQPEVSGGGLLVDLGSHALDLLDFFGGALEEINGHAARLVTEGDVEDAVAFSFRTARGVPGSATFNFASLVKEDVLELTGPRGRVLLSVFGNEPVRFESARGVETFDLPNPPHIQQPLIQTVVDDLLGRGTCPSTGESARRTNVVIDRVLAAYYGGRTDAFWARPQTWPGRNGPAARHSSP
jgi:1,5-anhydro-D-fructose reductase (1,5-anhydro-D-mannitol-forming)